MDSLRNPFSPGAGSPPPERVGRDSVLEQITSLGPIRSKLIAKGMIYSPSHGDVAFTVPLFDEFMRRSMPGSDWCK